MADNYTRIKIIEFPNMIVRVHLPDLTEEERAKRMTAIRKATENLLKKVPK